MAPIKFEENIREKLQERELQPSKDSWKKLSASLDDQMPKRKRGSIWMAVAAGLIGILLAVTFLFSPKEEMITDEVVENKTEEPSKIESNEEVPLFKEAPDEEITQDVANENVEGLEEKTIIEDKIEATSNEVEEAVAKVENKMNATTDRNVDDMETVNPLKDFRQTNQEVMAVKEEKEMDPLTEEVPKSKEESFIQGKVETVVTAIQEIQKKNNTVTVEEIDALLARAQRDIATNRILNSGSNKVDATALLQDVETELERGFRDRVFEALGEGFDKVRTAVAERNN